MAGQEQLARFLFTHKLTAYLNRYAEV